MTDNNTPVSLRTLTQDDLELIEAIIDEIARDSSDSIESYFERLEKRIETAETLLYSQIASLENRLISDTLEEDASESDL